MTPLFQLFLFVLGLLMFLGSSHLTGPGNTLAFDVLLTITGLIGLYFVLVGLVRRD